MENTRLCLIRPPALPSYQDTDIKEDPMLSSLHGYLHAINFPKKQYDIFDFQLDKTISYDDLLKETYTHYIIAARDLGESYRYSVRIARKLHDDTTVKIYLYGQVSPLRFYPDLPERVEIVNQAEHQLALKIGLNGTGPHFTGDLEYLSYFDYVHLEDWQLQRKKGAIETTRGCPYKCKFCFISVGESYEKRWQVRPVESIMRDLKAYINQGIRQFVFLDSEFLGASPKYHGQKKQLLNRIIKELPPIKYMSLCRADTLQKFNRFDLLQKSGLYKVLVGVESLYQPDLDALRKDSSVDIMMDSIINLIEHDVECCLTFLTFHRNTTITGLRENLRNIQTLYQHPKARYLGMPNFSFNMEVIRGEYDEDDMEALTDITYLKPLLESRGQLNIDKAVFPTSLEPIIELFRLLQYEWVVKKCELIRVKVTSDGETKQAINCWFSKLGAFCVEQMLYFLDKFESGDITFENLLSFKELLFQKYKDYYKLLPANLRNLSTYESHAKAIDYKKVLDMENHGWDELITPSLYELARAGQAE